MSLPKLVVHTDVILEYLLHRQKQPPALRLLMMKFFCYTTAFNAIELFSLADGARERRAVEDAMNAMKILGLNAKQAKRYGRWFGRAGKVAVLDRLVAGVCLESRLPLATGKPGTLKGIRGLRIIDVSRIRAGMSAAQILAQARVRAK